MHRWCHLLGFQTTLHTLIQKFVLTYKKSFLSINFLNFSCLQYMTSLFQYQFPNSGTTQNPGRGEGKITNQRVLFLALGSSPSDSVALYPSPEKKVTEVRDNFSFQLRTPEALQFYRGCIDQVGEGRGNPLQYSCMKNSIYKGSWKAAVYGVTKSQTQLKRLSHAHTHAQPWQCFPCGSVVKNSPANVGNAGLISGSRRSPGEGNGNPLQYSLGNHMD